MGDENKAITGLNRLAGAITSARDRYRNLRQIRVKTTPNTGAKFTALNTDNIGPFEVEGVEKDGYCVLNIPRYGRWSVTGSLNNKIVAEAQWVDVLDTRQYTLDMPVKIPVNHSIFVTIPSYVEDAEADITYPEGKQIHVLLSRWDGIKGFLFQPSSLGAPHTVVPYIKSHGGLIKGKTIEAAMLKDEDTYISTTFAGVTIKTNPGAKIEYAPKGEAGTPQTYTGVLEQDNYFVDALGTWTFTATVDGASTGSVSKDITFGDWSLLDLTELVVDDKPAPPPGPEPAPPVTYYLTINEHNENPETSCTYSSATAGHATGWDAWKDEPIFKQIRPCIVKDGAVVTYLDREDMSKTADGAPVDPNIDGDWMVEIPRCGYSIVHPREDPYKVYVEVSNENNTNRHCYDAFSLDSENGDCDFIYVSMFVASENNGVFESKPGKPYGRVTRTNLNNLQEWVNKVAERGPGWQPYSYYVHTLLQCLFLIVFKNRDAQAALAPVLKYPEYPYEYPPKNPGPGGPLTGTTDAGLHINFLGIRDWYRSYYWIAGVFMQIVTQFGDPTLQISYSWRTDLLGLGLTNANDRGPISDIPGGRYAYPGGYLDSVAETSNGDKGTFMLPGPKSGLYGKTGEYDYGSANTRYCGRVETAGSAYYPEDLNANLYYSANNTFIRNADYDNDPGEGSPFSMHIKRAVNNEYADEEFVRLVYKHKKEV